MSIWQVIHFISICSFYEFQTLTSIFCLSIVLCFSGIAVITKLIIIWLVWFSTWLICFSIFLVSFLSSDRKPSLRFCELFYWISVVEFDLIWWLCISFDWIFKVGFCLYCQLSAPFVGFLMSCLVIEFHASSAF